MTVNNNQKMNESTKENALIFDFDGTLIDSQPSIMDSIQKVLSTYLGRDVMMDEVKDKYHADWKVMVKRFNIDLDDLKLKELITLWVNEAKEKGPEVKPFSFAHELLSVLDSKFDLYLWTGRDRKSSEYLLKEWDLDKFFINLSCGDDAVGTKPCKKSFIHLLNSKHYKSKIMIGDSLLDYYGAKEAEVPFIAVTWCSQFEGDTLSSTETEYFAKDPKECLDLINNISNKARVVDYNYLSENI